MFAIQVKLSEYIDEEFLESLLAIIKKFLQSEKKKLIYSDENIISTQQTNKYENIITTPQINKYENIVTTQITNKYANFKSTSKLFYFSTLKQLSFLYDIG